MGNAIVVNIFSSARAEKQSIAWELALALTKDGVIIECIPGYDKEFQSGLTDAELELHIRKQQDDIDRLKTSAEVVINYSPMLVWKLCRNLDVQFDNMIDDMIFQHNNFNIYLKPVKEEMEDLKIKSLLVSSGDAYGEYKKDSIALIASNIKKAHDRINLEGRTQQILLASRCYQNYASLKKVLNRYAVEAPGFHDVVGRLKEGGIATVEPTGENAYRIKYQNISAVYKKCGSYDMGILSNNYCGYESVENRAGSHRYDFKQQTEYRNRLRKFSYGLEP